MEGFLNKVKGISRFINVIAGISLTFIIALTVTDVILRYFRMPVVGTFELVAFSGAVVVGFAIPLTSWVRGHIFVDFFILRFSQSVRNVFNVITRMMGIWLFIMIGWNLIRMGMDLHKSGEVSLTLQMPFYPVAYGIGVVCLFQCLVLFCDILKIFRGQYE
ncbi:MAG: TRAP transporter small permease [Thermodesulfobacteriota bacterium]|nr:TRAP transporter small permease [Thermodesulfobacteriota bacterium]